MNERIHTRAARLYPNSRSPFRRVYERGAFAAIQGRPEDACPYPPDPSKSWRLAYRRAWLRGHADFSEADDV